MIQTDTTPSERNLAGFVHLASLLMALCTSWFAGFGGMLPSLVVWLMQADKTTYVARHAAEAFNFNFSVFIYACAAIILTIVTFLLGLIILIPLAVVFAVAWLVCSILATVAAFRGENYRYPFTIRLL